MVDALDSKSSSARSVRSSRTGGTIAKGLAITLADATLASIQVGPIAPLGPAGVPSGFVKSPIGGPVAVGVLGLARDEQADLTVHGGREKAVYAYPSRHYFAWADELPRHAALFVAGGLGENLTIDGWTEADCCVGDVHAIGTARLQLCQPRQPCFKLALRFDDRMMPKAMIRTGRAGWYYRVIEEGVITAGDAVVTIDRPNPDFGFARLVEIVNFGNANPDELHAMATMPGIASGIQQRAAAAVANQRSGRA